MKSLQTNLVAFLKRLRSTSNIDFVNYSNLSLLEGYLKIYLNNIFLLQKTEETIIAINQLEEILSLTGAKYAIIKDFKSIFHNVEEANEELNKFIEEKKKLAVYESTVCGICYTNIFLSFDGFRCKYCGGNFCSEHRIPEMHTCRNIDEAKSPSKDYVASYSGGNITIRH